MSPKYAKDQAAGFSNRIERVAIVGASGNMGGYFTKWLLQGGKHTVTAITRQDSTSRFPEGVHVARYTAGDHASMVAALQGQQFLVITLPTPAGTAGTDVEGLQLALIRAAGDAGVEYIMPNAYGPDPLNEGMTTQMLVGQPIRDAIREIEALNNNNNNNNHKKNKTKWVILATGFWWEWSLVGEGGVRFGIDFDRRTVTFFDRGEEHITSSTWDQCGRALAAYLALPHLPWDEDEDQEVATTTTTHPTVEAWANKAIYIASFRANQQDMFASAKRVTGTTDADWTVAYVDARERYAQGQAQMKAPATRFAGFSTQLYTRVFFPTGEGDHTRHGLANRALGLPEEDMDDATREGLRLVTTGKLSYAHQE